MGCGPKIQEACSTQGAEGMGHGLEELLPPIPAKKFSCGRDTLSGGQQSLCSTLRASIPSLGCFLLQHFSPGLHLCPFYGVQCFSSPTSIPLLAPLSPSHTGSSRSHQWNTFHLGRVFSPSLLSSPTTILIAQAVSHLIPNHRLPTGSLQPRP